MATFDSDGPAWTATERTRRTVALNPPEALQDLLQLVASILSKILDNPSDPKYRSLKQSGRVCQQRLLGRPGGRELLASLGFKSDERADAIALSSNVDDAKLRCAIAWCASFQPPRPHVAIVIRLPSGARLEAAFGADETLRDVRAYADACAPKGAPYDLGQAGGIRYDDDALDQAVSTLGPRAARPWSGVLPSTCDRRGDGVQLIRHRRDVITPRSHRDGAGRAGGGDAGLGRGPGAGEARRDRGAGGARGRGAEAEVGEARA